MNINNHPPVLVPVEFQSEIASLSKAALMDMVWDYAQQIADEQGPDEAMKEFRSRREIILAYRTTKKSRAKANQLARRAS